MLINQTEKCCMCLSNNFNQHLYCKRKILQNNRSLSQLKSNQILIFSLIKETFTLIRTMHYFVLIIVIKLLEKKDKLRLNDLIITKHIITYLFTTQICKYMQLIEISFPHRK